MTDLKPRVVANWPARTWWARLPDGGRLWHRYDTWHAALHAVGLWHRDRSTAPVNARG